jgi:hypothetical protein
MVYLYLLMVVWVILQVFWPANPLYSITSQKTVLTSHFPGNLKPKQEQSITYSCRHLRLLTSLHDLRIYIILFRIVSVRFQAVRKQVLIGSRRDCASRRGSLIQRHTHVIRLLEPDKRMKLAVALKSRSYKTGFISSCKLKP